MEKPSSLNFWWTTIVRREQRRFWLNSGHTSKVSVARTIGTILLCSLKNGKFEDFFAPGTVIIVDEAQGSEYRDEDFRNSIVKHRGNYNIRLCLFCSYGSRTGLEKVTASFTLGILVPSMWISLMPQPGSSQIGLFYTEDEFKVMSLLTTTEHEETLKTTYSRLLHACIKSSFSHISLSCSLLTILGGSSTSLAMKQGSYLPNWTS